MVRRAGLGSDIRRWFVRWKAPAREGGVCGCGGGRLWRAQGGFEGPHLSARYFSNIAVSKSSSSAKFSLDDDRLHHPLAFREPGVGVDLRADRRLQEFG